MKIIYRLFIFCICLFFLAGCTSKSSADKYPDKSIQMVVAYSPGAATDTQARIIAKYAKKYLGQEMVIVNKPGGGGQVGWNYFSSVKPDGYILAAYNLPHIITQPMVGDTSYNLDTFEPIVNWGGDPTVFAVRSDSQINTLDDLIRDAKQSPGTMTIGNAGRFVGQHLAILLLENAAKIEVEDVPFKGSSEAISSLLGGHTDVLAGNLSDIYRLGSEVRPLAIASEKRHPFAPDIPTFKELGFPQIIMSTDRGIAAREGTPEEIIEKLEKAFLELLEDQDFLEEMEKAGADMLIMDRQKIKKEIEQRSKDYKELLESIHVVN
ncbi:tripartite tricarboxylate transporter substrate binding protein [Sediminibacillus dalangtanensis]|uniref:Tripartite tricarboxylate transporter substrate binding protein n=1 Tax=Sediminibacillus dalangtanensis TaxID=2729421 RepID=A0ABX7VRL1_9BACI|nr:tripartite tricarboxylate transporter substrate binding protein [Sediminibacillus dalangtanensis]QTM99559.1 tripartite tricarboxylate transporter substrate binding protein [Sediminibacillus dalangtanensis]